MILRVVFVILGFALLAAAAPAGARAESVTALVAASTVDAVTQIAQTFREQTGTDVKVSHGASNLLAQQILQGAPADLFLSANAEWTKAINDEGLVETSRPLLGNSLVVVVPAAASFELGPAKELAERDRIERLALAGENVPAGKYAEQALRHYELYDALVKLRRIVRGQDVRSALTYVERGEADAAIVYASDVHATDTVKVAFTFAPESHEKIVYPVALLKTAKDKPEAARFYEFLSSPAAADIFRRQGFTPLAADGMEQAPPTPATSPAN